MAWNFMSGLTRTRHNISFGVMFANKNETIVGEGKEKLIVVAQ